MRNFLLQSFHGSENLPCIMKNSKNSEKMLQLMI